MLTRSEHNSVAEINNQPSNSSTCYFYVIQIILTLTEDSQQGVKGLGLGLKG